jgi:hypothetical protein
LAGPSGHARLVNTGHDYCWLVDSRCRAFIHCSKAASLADGSADPDVRRAIAAHADLRQPRQADFEKLGRSLLVSEGRRPARLVSAPSRRREKVATSFRFFLWQQCARRRHDPDLQAYSPQGTTTSAVGHGDKSNQREGEFCRRVSGGGTTPAHDSGPMWFATPSS